MQRYLEQRLINKKHGLKHRQSYEIITDSTEVSSPSPTLWGRGWGEGLQWSGGAPHFRPTLPGRLAKSPETFISQGSQRPILSRAIEVPLPDASGRGRGRGRHNSQGTHCTILALTNCRKKYSVNSTDKNTVIQAIALPKPNFVSSIASRVI